MSHIMNQIWQDEIGVLTFEWILLITVLVIGIVGGLSAVRDATVDELGDVSEGMVSLDQSYWINVPIQASIYDPLSFPVTDYISGSANAYKSDGEWVYTPSWYSDERGVVTRGRPTEDADFNFSDEGMRLTQEIERASSVDNE